MALPVNTFKFHHLMLRLRGFFLSRGYLEVHVQNRLSILSCEKPEMMLTISGSCPNTGNVLTWPLPQTGQMWLDRELLQHPEVPGVFAVSTSYRSHGNDAHPRLSTEPMFEFTGHGEFPELLTLEHQLLHHFGFGDEVCEVTDADLAEMVRTRSVSERVMRTLGASAILLRDFPIEKASWTMRRNENETVRKADVYLGHRKVETLSSAELSCDRDDMYMRFVTQAKGQYHKLLGHHFGEERVRAELDGYLKLQFTPRFSASIGITRLLEAMRARDELEALISKPRKQ